MLLFFSAEHQRFNKPEILDLIKVLKMFILLAFSVSKQYALLNVSKHSPVTAGKGRRKSLVNLYNLTHFFSSETGLNK